MLCCAPGLLNSEPSLTLTDKYTGPLLTCPTWAIILQRNLSSISSSFPLTQMFQADASHKNHQKACLGQISTGTLPPPQKSFSKFLWEGTIPWMTTICSWAPCVPMAHFVCRDGLVAGAVAFQHSQKFLHHFFFLIPFSESLLLKGHLVHDRVS